MNGGQKMKKTHKIICLLLLLAMSAVACCVPASALAFGDVDGDGRLLAADARMVLRASVNLVTLSEEQKKAADTDCDKAITAADARNILRLCVGLGNTDDSCMNGMDGATLVGISQKGYRIYVKNGMTYVDGLLIANKTYALPSSYNPGALLNECYDAFDKMQTDAWYGAGLYLYEISGFRSYETQQNLYDRYVATDGKAEADTYSARPGHSEHQTGLALDVNSLYESFADTAEGRWLAANAHKYGFIIRYPKGKTDQTGYIYEPWHIRYVGVEKATKIFNSGLCLEEYYGLTSVYAD